LSLMEMMKALAVPSENPRLILIAYDDGSLADPKVIEWVVSRLNESFAEIGPPVEPLE